MEILKKIWNFINSKIFGYIFIAIIIILLINQFKRAADLKRENIQQQQNISAADSIISSYKNNNNEYVAEKAIWILSEKELKKQNKELYDEVKNQNGQIISLNNTIFKLVQDTILLHDSISYLRTMIGEAEKLNGTKWNLPWELQYVWDEKNHDNFKGHTIVEIDTVNYNVKHVNTVLDERNSQIDLIFGEKVVGGKYSVYVSSKYPGLTTNSMAGVLIDPNTNTDIKDLIEKRHWFTGFGVGPTLNVGYDFINQKPAIIIGVGIHYNIYNW